MFALTTAQRREIGEWLREPARAGDNRIRVFIEDIGSPVRVDLYPDRWAPEYRTFRLTRERVGYQRGWWQWFVADPETGEPIAFGPLQPREDYGSRLYGSRRSPAWTGTGG